MDTYAQMADMYDLIYAGDFDVDYYVREAKKTKGEVLEIGCGTGRVMLELLKQGVKVEGLDISADMLRILKNKAKALGLPAKVYKADMRKFDLKKKYSLILIPYRSFLHLSSDKERTATLKNIHSHLEKGGRVIIHVYNPSEEDNTGSEFRPIDIDNFELGGEKVTAFWYMRYIPLADEAEYLIELHKKNKRIKQFKMKLYFVKYAQMKKLFEDTGFSNANAYSDFTEKKFTHTTAAREVIWVAQK